MGVEDQRFLGACQPRRGRRKGDTSVCAAGGREQGLKEVGSKMGRSPGMGRP